LDSTGSVLRLLTARLTTCRPRARFSCITESFTSLELPSQFWATSRAGALVAEHVAQVIVNLFSYLLIP
jgi:hypothetical protein